MKINHPLKTVINILDEVTDGNYFLLCFDSDGKSHLQTHFNNDAYAMAAHNCIEKYAAVMGEIAKENLIARISENMDFDELDEDGEIPEEDEENK